MDINEFSIILKKGTDQIGINVNEKQAGSYIQIYNNKRDRECYYYNHLTNKLEVRDC